ncbi:hypothetical protein LGT39_05445 [Demequina sp. TTPB684]|uniref:PIN-like domain-containing protein n=1 Tax=unclassified Demequina TaxID=2620311 RepID=UPI001CF5794B|nr:MULTISPECIES: PIN-like domain-containing protein [unclassified Demequina]MCB2412291.1 hypothetical protein [Demequina sp. TTPB684]UPU87571.1 PIN-like domain-containing protein [Demequina sp. TMPB413]
MVLGSLDDDFAEYEQLTDEQQVEAVREGLVVLDTNVVLNLYRYDQSAADALFAVLQLIGDRLYVPHQVAREFWSRRRTVIRQRSKDIEEILKSLESFGQQIEEKLSFWRRRTGAPEAVSAGLFGEVDSALQGAREDIALRAGETKHEVDTRTDAVLGRLRVVFVGKVGSKSEPSTQSADIADGLKRFDQKVPPGYGDTDKSGEARAGDYLVWIQALREAKARQVRYLVVVTEDSEKGDWFEREGGATVGANLALVREARDYAGAQLLLVRTARLLDLSRKALDAQITEESLSSIDQVSSSGSLWTDYDIELFMERLAAYSSLHALVVEEAAGNGGRISRERIYEMGGFDSDRTLRGFTRPTRTVMKQLQAEEALSSKSLPEPLVAVYESPDSYVLASHFLVPREFVQWFWGDSSESSSS